MELVEYWYYCDVVLSERSCARYTQLQSTGDLDLQIIQSGHCSRATAHLVMQFSRAHPVLGIDSPPNAIKYDQSLTAAGAIL